MYHSHYILLIQSILVFPIASDENLGVEARDCRGKAACYTPNFLEFPKISCGFLKRVLEKRKYMEIGKSRKLEEIYGNIMLLPTISISRFSWWSCGNRARNWGIRALTSLHHILQKDQERLRVVTPLRVASGLFSCEMCLLSQSVMPASQ